MSVDHLLTELQQRGLLSQPLLDKLREAVADAARPLSARSLAKFLVQKQHLTQLQATNVIHALIARGIDVDASSPPSTLISTIQPAPIPASQLNSSDPEEDEGSSIFPYMPAEERSSQPPTEEDELTLVAIDEDEAPSASQSPEKNQAEEDLPAVGLLVPDDDRPGNTSEHEAEVPWTIEPAQDSQQMSIAEMDARIKPAPFDDVEESPLEQPAAKRLPGDGKDARKRPGLRKKKDWDSPLMLYGGGGLALMLLTGAAVLWILNWEKGDQELRQAKQALDGGAYAQAIEHYEQFLENSPRHPERSQARVRLAMARLRQATEAGNFTQALDMAPNELEAVEDEEDFDEAHGELAALLPQIAAGLARQAEAAGAGHEEVNKLIEQAKTALEMCNNVLYIPKTLRDEGKLNVVREHLRRVEHREQSHLALQKTLEAMEKAISAGDTAAAFSAHRELVKERLEMAGNARLAEMIQKAVAAETEAVKFVRQEQAAETSEPPTPWVAALALAHRRGPATPGEITAMACVLVDGAVYGLDVATGKLRWRRFVGFRGTAWPTPLGQDVLVSDTRTGELLRLNAATGKLVWRQAIGEPFSEPLIVGQQAFVAAQSGRLYLVDLETGGRAGYVQFPQPLAARPAIDRRRERLYVAASQFCLYVVSREDLKCVGAYYLGHDPTSIQFPPACVLNKLAVLESDGIETSRLRLLSLDAQGAIAGQETERRLGGAAASPLLVEGRRLIVATDRGQFDVYEITAAPGDAALAQLATREPTDSQPVVRYAAVADGHIWVADTRLTKHAILPTGNRLPVVSIDHNFAGDAFDHPLQAFGRTLIHVGRPKGLAGVVAAATDTGQGRLLWETDLAVPPAAAPVVDSSGRALVVANANGYVFRFDEAAIRSRVQDEPLQVSPRPAAPRPLTSGVPLSGGGAVYFAPQGDSLLLYPAAETGGAARWITLPSPLACSVTPVGDAFIAPMEVGQVFYLNSANGEPLAAPFQPKLQPRTIVHYQPAADLGPEDHGFLITDGAEKIYRVQRLDEPQPHLASSAEAEVGPNRIVSPVVTIGSLAIAATEGGHLVSYSLPQLKRAGEVSLPGEAVWGPFRVGDQLLLATANEQLVAVSAAGAIAWTAPIEHGDLAGPPLEVGNGIVLAYRSGIVERRDAGDGKPLAHRDVEQPLAASPISFAGRLVLAAQDGTLLVVNQP